MKWLIGFVIYSKCTENGMTNHRITVYRSRWLIYQRSRDLESAINFLWIFIINSSLFNPFWIFWWFLVQISNLTSKKWPQMTSNIRKNLFFCIQTVLSNQKGVGSPWTEKSLGPKQGKNIVVVTWSTRDSRDLGLHVNINKLGSWAAILKPQCAFYSLIFMNIQYPQIVCVG